MMAPELAASTLTASDTSGRPLLIVGPSLGTSASTVWSRCAELRAEQFDVVAWDLPGHGRSRAARGEFTIASLANAVLELVETILIERGRWFGPGFTDRRPEFTAELLHGLRDADAASYAWACGVLAAFDVRDGFYDALTVTVLGTQLSRDEGIQPESSRQSFADLRPAFRPDGTTLARAGIAWDEVGAVELNEAFAVQSLACMDAWKIDPDLVNTRGGAVAIGHPLDASGGRILGTLAEVLRRDRVRWGMAAICIGVGQALAVVLENVSG
jgi:hypothetical protein